jgi:hypothetical protein
MVCSSENVSLWREVSRYETRGKIKLVRYAKRYGKITILFQQQLGDLKNFLITKLETNKALKL